MKKLEMLIRKNRNIINIFLNTFLILALFVLMFACGAPSGNYVMLEKQVAADYAIAEEPTTEQKDNFNTEEYDRIYENQFKDVTQNPLSTFSIDVDKASYSNVRRFLEDNQLPPKDAVRIEELINYFHYNYPQPGGDHPFSIYTETAECPWNKEHILVHVGLQGKKLDYENLKPSNLVFLLDVSGSMDEPNKLPLVKKSMNILIDNLNPADKVAIVVYAGASGVVLPSTSMDYKDKIIDALDKLSAGGSTAGGEGIEKAYKIAQENLIPNGNNRVILCTDGDFNVGVSSTGDLVRLIEEKRKLDIYLTICGFGMGNYKDGRLEQISNTGNGNYFYIDNREEAEKVFAKELRANMFTIAKDVKIQVEFNPVTVKAYRLIGYENRVMANEDFNNDTKDAGELGAGHTVTALYEVVPIGAATRVPTTDKLKYQETKVASGAKSDELLTIKFRYKPIHGDSSKLITQVVEGRKQSFNNSSPEFRFSAAVAGFGMLLRDSEFKGTANYEIIHNMAEEAITDKSDNYKTEFLTLLEKADKLAQK
jgi:Ca-activated chloride channel family protein